MSEIQRLTPQLLKAVEVASGQPSDSAAAEDLNQLSQEWATQVTSAELLPPSSLSPSPCSQAKRLMRSVDNVSLGVGGPADTLLIAARSGDPGLLQEQSSALTELAASLHNIAQDAVEG